MAVEAHMYPERLGLPIMASGLQDWIDYNHVSGNGVDACSNFQDPQQRQNLFFSGEISPSFRVDNNTGAGPSSSPSTSDSSIAVALSQSLDAHFRMQREEIDYILQLQNDRLRSALQEQSKLQLETLVKSAESKALSLMKQKEEKLAEARRKTLELEGCLRKSRMESEFWQRMVKTKESMIVELTHTLEQFRERVMMSERGQSQDAESCCDSCEKEQEDTHIGILCKSCNSGKPCVLFLPCRHLCCCKLCEAFLGKCPVCESVKEASIEVFWC